MNRITLVLAAIFLAGCSRGDQVAPYASCKIGERYEVQKDMLALEYDYMQIPLVKPGIQIFDIGEDDLGKARPEMKIVKIGKVHKGDIVVVESFVEEGGWIPCKGNWYMANPMVRIQSGDLAGKTIGISLLCDYQRDKPVNYKTGKVGFMKVDPKYLVIKN